MKAKAVEVISLEEEKRIITFLQRGYATQVKEMIVSEQLSPNKMFPKQNSRVFLHLLVENENNNELLQWLLENKLDILNLNAQDLGGLTPIMCAAIARNYKAMELLLAYGADPDIENRWKEKLIDVVRLQDVNWVFQAKCLIQKAKEGDLLKPTFIESHIATIQQRQSPQKPTNLLASKATLSHQKIVNASSFSLEKFFEKIKFPFFNQKIRSDSSEVQPLMEKKQIAMPYKLKKL